MGVPRAISSASRVIGMVLAAGVCCRAAAPGEVFRARLARTVTVEWRGKPLLEALRELETLGSISIFVSPRVARMKATLDVPGVRMPLEDHLRWAARLADLRIVVRDDAVFLMHRADAFERPIRLDYDVRSLVIPDRRLRGDGPVEQTGGSVVPRLRGVDALANEPQGHGLAAVVQHRIAPGTWGQPAPLGPLGDEPKTGATYTNGHLVVVHNPDVHKQVERFLNNLRRTRSLQVHISARFILTPHDEFQRLGLELRRTREGARLGQPSLPPELAYAHITPKQVQTFLARLSRRRRYLLGLIAGKPRGQLLACPHLTCFRAQRAGVQVVFNFGYVSRVTSDDEPEIGNTPEGFILDVQPFVSADRRFITLPIDLQLSRLVSSKESRRVGGGARGRQTQTPTVELRRVSTTVTIADGGTVFLGGPTLYVERQRRRREGRLGILLTAEVVPDIFEEE